ncbi:MAG: ROK family protein [Lachnospiraceae bacterium]|nr:ROK family protein [Lachnospiraceae bacterium]
MDKICFGIDVGGTTVKRGVFDSSRKLLRKWEIPTRTEEQGAHILEDIRDALIGEIEDRGLSMDQVQGAGIGLPGPVTPDGIVNHCVNLGWGRMNVEKDLSRLLGGVPVHAENDANIAALGEALYGAGAGHDSMVMVTLGTGIGGGVVLHGKLVSGSHGAAGEIGHIPSYRGAKKPCNCGNIDCMEQIGSATGIAQKAVELMEETDWPSALRDCRHVTARDVMMLHGQGDAIADATIEAVVDALGRGMATIGCVIDPEVFVVGGGVSKAGQWLMDALEERFERYAFHACRGSRVIAATLGNDAGIYGAAALALQEE